MDHVMQGMTNRGIAASLFISSGTVKSHLDHIFQKLGVRTRAEAVARYAEIENADTEESVVLGRLQLPRRVATRK